MTSALQNQQVIYLGYKFKQIHILSNNISNLITGELIEWIQCLSGWKLIPSNDNWNIWLDDQCELLESRPALTGVISPEKCQQACLTKPGCNAINFNPSLGCQLRACNRPIPFPSSDGNGYLAYAYSRGGMDWRSKSLD